MEYEDKSTELSLANAITHTKPPKLTSCIEMLEIDHFTLTSPAV